MSYGHQQAGFIGCGRYLLLRLLVSVPFVRTEVSPWAFDIPPNGRKGIGRLRASYLLVYNGKPTTADVATALWKGNQLTFLDFGLQLAGFVVLLSRLSFLLLNWRKSRLPSTGIAVLFLSPRFSPFSCVSFGLRRGRTWLLTQSTISLQEPWW